MNRRNFIHGTATTFITAVVFSMIGCKKDSFDFRLDEQLNTNDIRKILLSELNAGHEQIFLASNVSKVSNMRISRRYNPEKILNLEITGIIFIGNETTALKKNMSALQVGDKKYFVKRFDKSRPLLIPVQSSLLAGKRQSITYLVENDIKIKSTRTIYL